MTMYGSFGTDDLPLDVAVGGRRLRAAVGRRWRSNSPRMSYIPDTFISCCCCATAGRLAIVATAISAPRARTLLAKPIVGLLALGCLNRASSCALET
jgi:hypothetical protein